MEWPTNIGLVKLPPRLEVAVFLIKAELKNRKFTKGLEQVGFDTALSSLDFSSLILKLIGFEACSDETFEFYSQMLEEYVQRIDLAEDDKNLNEQAFNFYSELEAERKKQHKS